MEGFYKKKLILNKLDMMNSFSVENNGYTSPSKFSDLIYTNKLAKNIKYSLIKNELNDIGNKFHSPKSTYLTNSDDYDSLVSPSNKLAKNLKYDRYNIDRFNINKSKKNISSPIFNSNFSPSKTTKSFHRINVEYSLKEMTKFIPQKKSFNKPMYQGLKPDSNIHRYSFPSKSSMIECKLLRYACNSKFSD